MVSAVGGEWQQPVESLAGCRARDHESQVRRRLRIAEAEAGEGTLQVLGCLIVFATAEERCSDLSIEFGALLVVPFLSEGA